jgi:hypothetical protein
LQDIIMREAPSAYIFESDGTARRRRSFENAEPPLLIPGGNDNPASLA